MQLLSDYLAGIATMSRAIGEHQQKANELLRMFNDDNLNAIELHAGPYNDVYRFTPGSGSIPATLVKECLQQLTEYHMTEVRKLEAELEDLVKARYLENSH